MGTKNKPRKKKIIRPQKNNRKEINAKAEINSKTDRLTGRVEDEL